MSGILEQVVSNVYHGRAQVVTELVRDALTGDLTPTQILNDGLIAGMDEIGQDFKTGAIFVPEVLVAARAMRAGMDVLRPQLAESDVSSRGKFVLGTVRGDLHDIGKNLVKMMLEGAGFEVVDLGINVEPERFVVAVQENQPQVLGMSALLTTTMPWMEATVEALESAGLRDTVKVMVGGAPLTPAFAKQIGADGYASDAASAADIARDLTA